MSTSGQDREWVSVAEAAEAANLPVRTVYNLVKTASIASRKQDGVALVRLTEVLAKARERAAAPSSVQTVPATRAMTGEPAPHAGNGAGASTLALATQALPPDLLAHLIHRFEEGDGLPTIVEELRLPTEVVLEAHRQYELLVARSGQPSPRQRLEGLADACVSRINDLEERFAAVERSQVELARGASAHIDSIRQELARMSDQIANLRSRGDEGWQQVVQLVQDHSASCFDLIGRLTTLVRSSIGGR